MGLRVWVYPGIREDAVAIAMGGGHTDYGRFANGNGVNPMALLPVAVDGAIGHAGPGLDAGDGPPRPARGAAWPPPRARATRTTAT